MKFNIVEEKTNKTPDGLAKLNKVKLILAISDKKNHPSFFKGQCFAYTLGKEFGDTPQGILAGDRLKKATISLRKPRLIFTHCFKTTTSTLINTNLKKNKIGMGCALKRIALLPLPVIASMPDAKRQENKKTLIPQQKILNYLQFLLYQDLKKNHHSNSYLPKASIINKVDKKMNNSSIRKLSNIANPQMVDKNLDNNINKGLTLQSKEYLSLKSFFSPDGLAKPLVTKTKTYSSQKWGSFFPYRKSFVCYWLLPLVGFVSYLSNNNLTFSEQLKINKNNPPNSGVLFTVNILNTNTNSFSSSLSMVCAIPKGHSMKIKEINTTQLKNTSVSDLKIKQNVQELMDYPENITSIFLLLMAKPSLTELSLAKPSVTENGKKQNIYSFSKNQKNLWYQTTLLGSIKSNISMPFIYRFSFLPFSFDSTKNIDQRANLYPNKFYGLPLNLFATTIPLEDSGKSLLLSTPDGLAKLHKVKLSQAISEKIIKKKAPDGLAKLHFVKLSQAIREKISYTSNNYLYNLSLDTSKEEKTAGQPNLNIKGSLNKYLLGIKSLKKINNNIDLKTRGPNKNPILSYKKGSYVLDELFKELQTSTSLFTNIYGNTRKNSFFSFALANNKNLFVVDTQENNGKNIKKVLSKDSLNKILENNKHLKIGLDQRLGMPYGHTRTNSSSNNVNQKKLNYLEEMINFLEKTKNNTGSNVNLSTVQDVNGKITNQEKTKQSIINKLALEKQDLTGLGLTHLKITKEQLYRLILNSLSDKINLVIPNAQEGSVYTKGIDSISPDTLKSVGYNMPSGDSNSLNNSIFNTDTLTDMLLSKVIKNRDFSLSISAKNKGIKLNHPLLFSNVKGVTQNTNFQSQNRDKYPVKENSITNNSFLILMAKPSVTQPLKNYFTVPNNFFPTQSRSIIVSALQKQSKYKDNTTLGFNFSSVGIPFVSPYGDTLETVDTMPKGQSNLKENQNTKIRTNYFIYLNNKYINFVSVKFKEIVKPFYPFIFQKEQVSKFLLQSKLQVSKKQELTDLNLTLSSPTNKANPLVSQRYLQSRYNHTNRDKALKNNKIYSVLRSYLSKKQFINSFKTNKDKVKKTPDGLAKLNKFKLSQAISEKNLKMTPYNLLKGIGNKEIQNKTFLNLQFTKENIKKQKYKQKQFSPKNKKYSFVYSTNSLFKNRVFLLKSNNSISNNLNNNLNLQNIQSNNNNSLNMEHKKSDFMTSVGQNPYFEKLEKRKYNQKKHRRKKQRKETRHRKKRKRFYPRATWSRYKMYTNLLNTSLSSKENSSLSLGNKVKTDSYSLATKKINNVDLYDSKDFYLIKQSVLAELKRSFWKSYWLRSNLKPYLNNIKLYLKDIEKSSTKETLSYGLTSFISYLSGINNYNFASRFEDIPFSPNSVASNRNSFGIPNMEYPVIYSNNSILTQNKWQLMTQIHEHNRIMYERIQTLILNIRENLTLNGHFKARPYKSIGQQKLRSLSTLKQNHSSDPNNPQGNPDFWSKFSKAISSFFTKSAIKYNGDFVNYRIYWAINKTNLGSFKTINRIKTLWMNTKQRDQSKANKTKKILYDLQSKNLAAKQLNNSNKFASLPLNSSMFILTSNDLLQDSGNSNINKKYSPSQMHSNQSFPEAKTVGQSRIIVGDTKELNAIYQDKEGTFLSYDNVEKIQLALQLTERKFRQKEQKFLSLGFLPTMPLTNSALEPYWVGLNSNPLNTISSQNSIGEQDWSKQNNTKASISSLPQSKKSPDGLAKLNKVNLRQAISEKILPSMESLTLLPGNFKNFSNEINYWWDASKFQFIPTFSNYPDGIPVGDTRSDQQNHLQSRWSDHYNLKAIEQTLFGFSPKVTTVAVISFLFHFCSAFALLISISQIRDFISFSMIVLSKVSKIYLNLIYSSYSLFFTFFFAKAKKVTDGLAKLNKVKHSLAICEKIAYTYKGRFLKQESKFYQQLTSISKASIIGYTNKENQNNFVETKQFSFSKSLNTKLKKPNKNIKSGLLLNSLNNKTNLDLNNKASILYTWYSILFYSSMNALSYALLSNLSFLTYSYFLKSLNFVETFVRSIYSFFEKPGELIIDWMAYFFLVEWSSDLTNTIPDTIDSNVSTFLTKSLKINRFPSFAFTDFLTQIVSSYGLLNMPSMYNSVSSYVLPFQFLTGSLIQRRILSFYLLALSITCRPDTDLLVRQQKGFVFWDIWSDLFITVAEDSNINVSELSNLKEEQNRLLEKLIESQTVLDKPKKKFEFNINTLKKSNILLLTKTGLLSTPSLFIGITLKNKNKKNVQNNSNYDQGDGAAGLTQANSLDNKLNRVSNNLSKNLIKTLSWSSSQFLSYQGKDTELFIDLHPPKSFSHVTSIKYSESINQPIGLVLCQVFSGIFYKQVAKNLLVVGPQGDQPQALIQAIAGETELKIITDNAYRYAMVFRGVAVGIKLLRDVFEALTLHTPCIFLLEDIHAIGERRPFLISDNENTKGIESSIYLDKDSGLQGNEKNQVIYQLTKHMVSHYKKPYKGDFSLLIPTNHFCFDLFNSQNGSDSIPKRRQKSTLTSLSPLSLTTKDNNGTSSLVAASQLKGLNKSSSGEKSSKDKNTMYLNNADILSSSVQLPKNQLLAPPATSPFSVLVLKEEKKFKPKKLVKEYPWSGLPYEQYSNIAKATYSIRVKVALLADMVLSNLSVKLDMITDLLVIIDSVKGNRGFVVFATTHIPYILDPALRRPGRFDETLSLPKIPNLLSRWQICKYNINLSYYKPGHNTMLNKTSLPVSYWSQAKATSTINYGNALAVTYPIGISLNLWESNTLFASAAKNNLSNRILKTKICKANLVPLASIKKHSNFFSLTNILNSGPVKDQNQKINKFKKDKKSTVLTLRIYNLVSKIFLLLHFCHTSSLQSQKLPMAKNSQTNYSQEAILMDKWGDFVFSLIHSNSNVTTSNNIFANTLNKVLSKDYLVYTSLYSSPNIFKQHLSILMAGQLGYLFTSTNIVNSANFSSIISKTDTKNTPQGLPSLTIFDNTWRTASSLIYSFIQKRWIYSSNSNKKNTIKKEQSLLFGSPVLNSLFDFGLEGYKTEIPSPPSSNILLPAKRYENYKRTFIYSQLKRKTNTSISDTIQIHQQQRLVKRLYKIPLKEYFRSEILTNFNIGDNFSQSSTGIQALNASPTNQQKNLLMAKPSVTNFSSFSNASIILAPLENLQQKPTSINWYFRQRILNRHRSYLSNQWWNGQLQEHNTESTFLSDIDWRYTISSSLPDQKQGVIGDLFIDFPDSEQYYNPKNQRWVNTSGSWNSWFDFHKASMQEYSTHYMFECITTAYKCLDKNRELLDYYVINILEKGITNISLDDEIELLEIFKRLG